MPSFNGKQYRTHGQAYRASKEAGAAEGGANESNAACGDEIDSVGDAKGKRVIAVKHTKKPSAFNEAKPRTPKSEARQREIEQMKAMEELLNLDAEGDFLEILLRDSKSFQGIPSTTVYWLSGGTRGARSLNFLHVFHKCGRLGVLLGF